MTENKFDYSSRCNSYDRDYKAIVKILAYRFLDEQKSKAKSPSDLVDRLNVKYPELLYSEAMKLVAEWMDERYYEKMMKNFTSTEWQILHWLRKYSLGGVLIYPEEKDMDLVSLIRHKFSKYNVSEYTAEQVLDKWLKYDFYMCYHEPHAAMLEWSFITGEWDKENKE